MRFEIYVALRFLREARSQTILIITGVSVGVSVLVFLTALIGGLQQSLIAQTLGAQPHIVVRPEEESARPMLAKRSASNEVVFSVVEKSAQRLRSIREWQKVVHVLSDIPGVSGVSPVVLGAAFAIRGSASRAVALYGIDPERFEQVIPVASKLRSGRFDVSGTFVNLGVDLADELGVKVGDKFRLGAPGASGDVFVVSGLFDFGNKEVNLRWVLVSLRNAQTLLDLVGGASQIFVRVDAIFAAQALSEEIAATTGLVSDSWMRTNAQLLVALESQSRSSQMIQLFVIVAVAMGIASVLIVSVVQKSREIGILRAMGTSRKQVQRVFLLEGFIVGATGAIFGSILGVALTLIFQALARRPDGTLLFPFELNVRLFATAAAIALATGVCSAVLPARRAARLDPAEAIRYV